MNQGIVPVKNLTLRITHDDNIEFHPNSDITLQSGDSLTFDVKFEIPLVFTDGAHITIHKKINIVVV